MKPWIRASNAELRLIASALAKLQERPRRRRRRSGFRRRYWTRADNAEFRRLYPDTRSDVLAQKFGRSLSAIYGRAETLGSCSRRAYLASPDAFVLRRHPELGSAYRFRKGHVPANKGLRRPGWHRGRMAQTWFRKGHRPQTWVPVGTEVRDADGYLKRKVSDRRRPSRFIWKYVHVMKWERKHGRVPRSHAVIFRNGDKRDTRLRNLKLVTRKQLMAMNTIHNLPPALKEVIVWRAALVRRIGRLQKAKAKENAA